MECNIYYHCHNDAPHTQLTSLTYVTDIETLKLIVDNNYCTYINFNHECNNCKIDDILFEGIIYVPCGFDFGTLLNNNYLINNALFCLMGNSVTFYVEKQTYNSNIHNKLTRKNINLEILYAQVKSGDIIEFSVSPKKMEQVMNTFNNTQYRLKQISPDMYRVETHTLTKPAKH